MSNDYTDDYERSGYNGPIPPITEKILGHFDADGKFHQVLDEITNVLNDTGVAPAKRVFESGAARDVDDNKLDFEGFLSPQVLLEFAEYMHKHRLMKDGSVRDSDNWQKGMPRDVLIKSLTRHFFDLWLMHRLGVTEITRPDGEVATLRETYGGLMFNLSCLWLDSIKEQR